MAFYPYIIIVMALLVLNMIWGELWKNKKNMIEI
jgi:hypothetical protein